MRTHHRIRGVWLAVETLWWLACVTLAVAVPSYFCVGSTRCFYGGLTMSIEDEAAEQVETYHKPFRQRVPFGSTVAEFDGSEADVVTRTVVVEYDSGDLLPTSFVRSVPCGDGSIDCRFTLQSANGACATYTVERD